MALPDWIVESTDGVLELIVPADGVLAVVLPAAPGSKCAAAFLSPAEISWILVNEFEFMNWVQPIKDEMARQPVFRLLGSQREIQRIAGVFSLHGFLEGAHVPLDDPAETLVHLIPAEGRIRIPKKATGCGDPPGKHACLDLDFSSLIAIGSSTGGTEALKKVLTSLPPDIPPILIVQHIPPGFSKSFADRINELCPFDVKEAEDGELVTQNKILIAPGGKHMSVRERDGQLKVVIEDSEPVNRHKPSVDVLFHSIALIKRRRIAAAILTGMGSDGARGLLKLRQMGAHTIAQDEATSIVYGMPREAFRIGGAEEVSPLEEIAGRLLAACAKPRGRKAV